MSGTYDPKSAAFALRDTIRRQNPRIMSSNVPGLVDEKGETYHTVERPRVEGLVLLVTPLSDAVNAAAAGDYSSAYPRDLLDAVIDDGVAGLKAHVRPDGGVFIGVFGHSPEDATVVFGDPLMGTAQAKDIVRDFWERQKIGPYKPKLHLLTDPPGAS